MKKNTQPDKVSLFRDTYVPIPSSIPHITDNHTLDEVYAAVDRYFGNIISGYPENTKQLLRDMYYREHNVFEVTNLPGASAAMYNDLTVEVVEDICCSPLLYAINAIHEIGVHIGQAHQRIRDVGREQFEAEWDSGDFLRFTELSAALVEKILLDAIPLKIFELETVTNFLKVAKGDITADAMLEVYKEHKEMNFSDYTALKHRDGKDEVSCLTMSRSDLILFKSRPDVKNIIGQLQGKKGR